MFIVIAKSPFWKSARYVEYVESYYSCFVAKRSKKRAYKFATREEAQTFADDNKGGINKWVLTVEEVK